MSKLTSFNYGIWRRVRLAGRKSWSIETQNGKIQVKADIGTDVGSALIRAAIYEKHPGWQISGYCETPTPRIESAIDCPLCSVFMVEQGYQPVRGVLIPSVFTCPECGGSFMPNLEKPHQKNTIRLLKEHRRPGV